MSEGARNTGRAPSSIERGSIVECTIAGNAISSGYFINLGDVLEVTAVGGKSGDTLTVRPHGEKFIVAIPRSHVRTAEAYRRGK